MPFLTEEEDLWKEEGESSGTSGQGKRLEGIRIKLDNASASGGVTYQTHVQSYGWQDWKSDGELAGTTGQGKRIEALRVKLTGEVADY